MKFRVIAVGLVKNKLGEYFLGKMPKNRGVYPGLWGLPGGGIEEGETMEQALVREMKEELGVKVRQIKPLMFLDDTRNKLFADGHREKIYMIYLIFECRVETDKVRLNPEWEEYAWVRPHEVRNYKLNAATKRMFDRLEELQMHECGCC